MNWNWQHVPDLVECFRKVLPELKLTHESVMSKSW